MAISRPRKARICAGEAVMRFSVRGAPAPPFAERSRSSASPLMRAPGGASPIIASESIVLPEPDSPTMPSVSPASSMKETSFTGRTHPLRVGKLDGELACREPGGHLTIIAARVTRGEVLRYRWAMSRPDCPLCQCAHRARRKTSLLCAMWLAKGSDRKTIAPEPEDGADRVRSDDADPVGAVCAQRGTHAKRLAHRLLPDVSADCASGELRGHQPQFENSARATAAHRERGGRRQSRNCGPSRAQIRDIRRC